MPLTDIYNFVPVSDELATAGQPTEDQLLEVAREGFGVVVNLGLLDPRYCPRGRGRFRPVPGDALCAH